LLSSYRSVDCAGDVSCIVPDCGFGRTLPHFFFPC
jgi:hypothetical protein